MRENKIKGKGKKITKIKETYLAWEREITIEKLFDEGKSERNIVTKIEGTTRKQCEVKDVERAQEKEYEF